MSAMERSSFVGSKEAQFRAPRPLNTPIPFSGGRIEASAASRFGSISAQPRPETKLAPITPIRPEQETSVWGRNLSPEVRAIRTDGTRFKTEEQADFARWMIQASRIPADAVRWISYRENSVHEQGVLGSAERGGDFHGRMTLYKDMNIIPSAAAQLGVVIHEGAHLTSPLDESATEYFGTTEKRMHALWNVKRIAKQTEATEVFLNPYHKYLYQEMRNGKISYAHWLEENHAISTEMATTNRAHLAQVEESQLRKLQRDGRGNEFVALTSQKDGRTGEWQVSGIDQTLMDVMKFDTVDEMHTYFDKLGDQLAGVKTPFHTEERSYTPALISVPSVEQEKPVRKDGGIIFITKRKQKYAVHTLAPGSGYWKKSEDDEDLIFTAR